MRRYVKTAVVKGSLRGVAREIGLSAPGLQHFLDGGTPFRKTQAKIAAWALTHAAAPVADEGAITVAAIQHLCRQAPGGRDVGRKILGAMNDAFETAGLPRPEWLTDMQQIYP